MIFKNNDEKNKHFYDKWYIPYNMRFIEKKEEKHENPYEKDQQFFYNHIHDLNVWIKKDPFDFELN